MKTQIDQDIELLNAIRKLPLSDYHKLVWNGYWSQVFYERTPLSDASLKKLRSLVRKYEITKKHT